MERHLIFELLGYTASALIVVSMMMSSIVRLRAINLVGAATFAGYGLLIHAYPVALLNTFTMLVNAVQLTRLLRTRECFHLLPLKPDSEYLPCFLDFHRETIRRIRPEFVYHPSPDLLALFILRNCNPAGVFIAERKPDGVLQVALDFVIPRYRDLKIGRFLFVEQAEFFRERGVREIVISPRTKKFGEYLLKVGFEPVNSPSGAFRFRYAKHSDESAHASR